MPSFSDALKTTSSWDQEKSNLVPPEVSEYPENNVEDIAKDITNYIKQDLGTEGRLAVFDIDTIDNYFKLFWKSKGIDWTKLFLLSHAIEKEIEKIEGLVADTISDETIRAQDGLVSSLSKEIAAFCRENRLDRASKKTIEEFLRAKELSLPERIKQSVCKGQ